MKMINKSEMTPKARKKIRLAAEIIKRTAGLFDGDKSMLPLWGAGVVTHGQPVSKSLEIGISNAARKATKKNETTRDHLYRVTATAEHLLKKASTLSVEQIEDILLQRAITMRVTRSENNSTLRLAINKCKSKDDWRELYRVAGVEYELY